MFILVLGFLSNIDLREIEEIVLVFMNCDMEEMED